MRFFSCFTCIFLSFTLTAQHSPTIDSLFTLLDITNDSADKTIILNNIATEYQFINPDTAIYYSNKAISYSQALNLQEEKVVGFYNLSMIYKLNNNNEKALDYFFKALKIAEDIKDIVYISKIYNQIGKIHVKGGEYKMAISYFSSVLIGQKEFKHNTETVMAYENLGLIYLEKQYYGEAEKCYLKLLELQNNTGNVLRFYNYLKSIYTQQEKYNEIFLYDSLTIKLKKDIDENIVKIDKLIETGENNINKKNTDNALDNFSKALKLSNEIGEKKLIATCYTNIAIAYSANGDYSKALINHFSALQLEIESHHDIMAANTFVKLKDVYMNQSDFFSALYCQKKALKLVENRMDAKNELANILIGLTEVELKLENYNKALNYGLQALDIFQDVGNGKDLSRVYFYLIKLYILMNDPHKAIEKLQEFSTIQDSLQSEQRIKEHYDGIYKVGNNYLQEQKSLEVEELNEEKKQNKKEIKRKQYIITFSLIGLILIGVFASSFFNRLKITKKQMVIIQKQKKLVDEKNKSILDSIVYARRIQTAILPPIKYVKKHLPDSFVLYSPKDVVSGDFYWIEPHQKLLENHVSSQTVLFSVVDCTGHGVSGAFVSIVGYNGLNRVVTEMGIKNPALILDNLNKQIDKIFSKSENEIKDGMDIALCSLEFPVHDIELIEKNTKLQFAGANNSLYIVTGLYSNTAKQLGEPNIKHETLDIGLFEIKGDRQPIGKHDRRKPFTNHIFELQKGDCMYIFSDGYADQFGGPDGKKFKYKQFKELFMSIYSKPMREQKEILNQTIETWKGDLEQVDDICVMGVKV